MVRSIAAALLVAGLAASAALGEIRAARADIAVWDRGPYAVPSAAIKDMACDMTLVRRRIVFDRGGR